MRRYSRFIFLMLCVLLMSTDVFAEVYAVKEWKGEYFKKKEGALFVKTISTGFPKVQTANVQVTLFGIIQQKSFTFSNTQTSADSYPREIWKFPSGKYRVEKIELVDADGVKRLWMSKSDAPTQVLVPRIMLSNLGVWTLSPSGANGLAVKFSMGRNTYQEKAGASDSSVAAVVNGFTGSIQQVIGGKKVLDGAKNDYSNDDTLRASASFTRQIAMFYKVDLFKHNAYAKDVMGSLAAYDPNLRTCYTRTLEGNPKIKGDLVLQVLASAKTGTIRQARKSRGSIADGTMIDCLVSEIQQIPMPVQANMIGEFTFIFDVK